MSESNVSDEDLRQLESLASLKELSLQKTQVSGIGIASVGRMTALRQLDVSRTRTADGDLRHLRALQDLTQLKLENTPITDAGLETLGAMPQLVRVSLGNTRVTDAGLPHLTRLVRLQALTLNGTNVTDKGLNLIAKMPGFAWMASPDAAAQEFVQRIELGQFKAMRDMYASGVTIPERGNYRLLSLEPLERSKSDQDRGWHRFKIQFHWVDRPKKTDEIMSLTIVVDRGAVLIMEVGIDIDAL